jgi:enoyl-CoA hydratase
MSILTLEMAGACAIVTLNRPKVLNAINTPLLDEIEAALDAIEKDNSRALILTGAGRAFCSGTDISGAEQHAESTEDFARARIARMHTLVLRLIDFPKPSIAALNGLAIGGGLEIALACTFRIAAPAAALGLSEIKLGLVPSYGGTQTLPRLIGQARALEMMLTGESVSAEEALRIGLVTRIDSDPVAAACAFAEKLPNGAGAAQLMIRRAVEQGVSLTLAEALEKERALAMEIAVSKEAKEGAAQFNARKQK